MGQEASVPVQSYKKLIREYQNLQFDYDNVADELDELYADYDAARVALMNKHRSMSELGVRGRFLLIMCRASLIAMIEL